MTDRDERVFENYSESYLLEERDRLTRLLEDAAGALGSIKAEILHRALEKAERERAYD